MVSLGKLKMLKEWVMAASLANKHILLGVTGGVAAYKSADLARRLREAGADVRVVMTKSAKEFITPLTMQAVSGNPVHDDLFDRAAEAAMGHIELARWADLILVAPATADFIARLANGHADDLLTTLCLATKAKMAVAPAMNQVMWQAVQTQQNVAQLQSLSVAIFGPGIGDQACGEVGPGRMLEPTEIVSKASELFANDKLAGVRIVITAGPTHEPIDPVRFIANGSSGKMGYALAEAACEAGASVTLISGPVHLATPNKVNRINVITAQEMHDEVMRNIADCDIFLAVAAVADYRVERIAEQKIHKNADHLLLRLIRNPDIAAAVSALPNRPFVIGFAAETENVINNAKAKRARKNLDMIIANHVGYGVGIGSDENEVTVISHDRTVSLPRHTKSLLARQLMNLIATEYQQEVTT